MQREMAPEHSNLPGWDSLLPLLLQGSLERRLDAATQKLTIVRGWEMPLLPFQILSPSFSSQVQDV